MQNFKFHATLSPRLDREIERASRLIDLDIERSIRRPTIRHEPISPDQTGDSRLLGGPMSIKSPWDDDDQPPPAC